MELDMKVVRNILRTLAVEVPGQPHVITETFILGPVRKGSVPDTEADHMDLLLRAGWIRTSRDVHMENHPDPATYRPTSAGMVWVRRAWNEEEWRRSISEGRRALKAADAELNRK